MLRCSATFQKAMYNVPSCSVESQMRDPTNSKNVEWAEQCLNSNIKLMIVMFHTQIIYP